MSNNIKYYYPNKNSVPSFDIDGEQNHFIYANGFTGLGSFEDFDLSQSAIFEKMLVAIPMGYKALIICERLMIFENGIKLMENTQASKHAGCKYRIYQKPSGDGIVEASQSGVLNSYGQKKINSYEWANINKAIEKAKRVSSQERRTILCKVIDTQNWH